MNLYQDEDSSHRPGSADELAERIETDVATGILAGGDRLPSVRQMAASLDLAPNTVGAAYRRLGERGVVVSRGRAGTFVLQRPPIGIHRSPVIPPGAIDLASGTPDPRLLPDLGRFLDHPGPSSPYTDPPILPELEAAGRAWLHSQGLDAGRFTLTSGGLDAIERVLTARLRPGDAVAVERPGWSAVTDLIGALGMRVVGVEIDDYGMVPSVLAERIGSVDAVVITPRAQNPTGAALDVRRRGALAAVLAERPDVLVVEDDHAGPVAGVGLQALGPGRGKWAFVQSVAKALGPDLRLAFVTGDDLTVDRVSGRFGIGPSWVSRILQRAVAEMVSDSDVGGLMDSAAMAYGSRRESLVAALRARGVAATGRSGLNVWVSVASEESAVAAALEAGFVIRPGSEFGTNHPAVRVTVSNLDEASIPRLASAVAEPGRGLRRLV
jgi:DNA-binding transcriptional MocR family regulator